METHPKLGLASSRGWVVVGAGFITMGLLYGIWYSYAVFLVALVREFGWSRAVVAGAFSGMVLVHGSVGCLFGALADRYGPTRVMLVGGSIVGCGLLLAAETTQWWHLYIAFGGIAAAGVGLSGYVPCVVLVRGWFPSRIGTVVGIASAGIGMGIAVLVPSSQYLIDQIGWRWTFRVLAALVVAWMAPATAWLLREPPPIGRPDAVKDKVDGPPPGKETAHWTLATALWSWRFWGLAVVLFTSNSAIQLLMVHQVAYLVDHGVPIMVAATVGGIVGLASVAGKVGWGLLFDRILREVVYTITSMSFLLGVGLLVLAASYPSTLLPYGYAIFIGLGYAAMAPLTPATASDLFGGPGFSMIFGALHMVLCVGTAVGAWAGGEIFDRTGGYAPALWVAVGLTLLSCILLWNVAPRRPNPSPVLR